MRFRVFSKVAQQIISWEMIEKKENLGVLVNNPKYELMQYTGLEDKNGKEIYENDIVRILYTDWGSKLQDDIRTLEQYLIDISHKAEVVFMGDRYWLKCGEKYDSIFPGTHGFIEIIGNIYENKDLLIS